MIIARAAIITIKTVIFVVIRIILLVVLIIIPIIISLVVIVIAIMVIGAVFDQTAQPSHHTLHNLISLITILFSRFSFIPQIRIIHIIFLTHYFIRRFSLLVQYTAYTTSNTLQYINPRLIYIIFFVIVLLSLLLSHSQLLIVLLIHALSHSWRGQYSINFSHSLVRIISLWSHIVSFRYFDFNWFVLVMLHLIGVIESDWQVLQLIVTPHMIVVIISLIIV